MKVRVFLTLFIFLLCTPSYAVFSDLKDFWDTIGKGFDKAVAVKELVVDVSEMKKLLEKLNVIEEGSLAELDELSTQLAFINEGEAIYSDIPGFALDQVPSDVWEYKANLEQLSTKQSRYTDNDVYRKTTIWANKKLNDLEALFEEDEANSGTSDKTKAAMDGIDKNTAMMEAANAQSLRKHQSRMSGAALKTHMESLELQRKLLAEAKLKKNKERIKELEDQIDEKERSLVFYASNPNKEREVISDIFRSFFR